MTRVIRLTDNKHSTIVDSGDFAFLSQFNWLYINGYAGRWTKMVKGKRKMIYMHRILAGTKSGQDTDHINMDRLDNRRCNVRTCTRAQNMCNRKRLITNTSGFLGVCKSATKNKFVAQICKNYKVINLGTFACPKKAAKAYNKAALKLHGEFANINAI